MIAKFLSKLSPTAFYVSLSLIFFFGCFVTNYIIITIDPKLPFPSTLPFGLLILPMVLSRIKTNPEEFANIPKNSLKIIFFSFIMGSMMELLVKIIIYKL